MNIEVIGRVRPSIRGEGPPTLIVDSHNKMASRTGGTYFTFSGFHRQESSNYDVYRSTVEPLLELFIAGFNTSLIITGESGSGKSFTVSGENVQKSGIVPLLLDGLFQRIEKGGQSYYDNSLHSDNVSMQIYEIYNELIKDLMVVPGVYTEHLDVQETAEKGAFVKNLSSATISSASDGASLFRQAFGRRTESQTDFGPARNHTAVVIHINLSMKTSETSLPNQCRFTIVITPGLEKLQEDANNLRLREGPNLSKSIISLSQLVAALANQPFADRVINYTESRLTYLLREEFGGNCKTRVLMCFRPQGDSNYITAALNFATQLSQVKNFPVINDHLTQQLLIQYRARIQNLQQQLGLGTDLGYTSQIHDANDELRKLQTDNLQLRDKNERLHMRLEQIQSKFGNLATTKTDLSTQLLMTEEEKLKVSKTLVEMQIENNKLKEEVESAKFQLTNKILQLEDSLIQTEVERDKHAKAAKNYKERLQELEKDRKTLAEEYIALKSNYLSMSSAHEREVAKNEELSMELMNLVKAKAALLRQIDGEESSTAEIDRVKAIVSRASKRPRDLPARKELESLEKSLFSDEKLFKGEVARIRDEYYDAERMLQEKMSSKNHQIAQLREHVRNKQKKIAELNAQLITLRNTSEQIHLQNNRLQHKLKDINDEFKSRLVKYIEDIAQFVDKEVGKQDGNRFRTYVDEMIKDLKKAHKVREEQLSQAAQSARKMAESTARKHEELLVAYRELRDLVEERGLDDIELGPTEEHLQLTDRELQSKQQKEINRLRDEMNQYRTELESLRIRLRVEDHKGLPVRSSREIDNWSNLRKQIHEFTATTQQELELERAHLLSKNAVLEQEVEELRSYIDNHLVRYKEEINRLRQMLGISDPVAMGFASPPLRQ